MNLVHRRSILTTRSLLPILLVSPAFAYPIKPAPLHLLTSEADLIIVASVVEVEGADCRVLGDEKEDGLQRPAAGPEEPVRAAASGTATAKLQVLDVLKGLAKPGDTVLVPFFARMVCPAPPRYVTGETLVVFLRRDAKNGDAWRTCSLSYGTRVLTNDDERDAYATRIREFLAIEAVEGDGAGRSKLFDCLVTCTEHPATRWDGAYEILYALERRGDNPFSRREGMLETTVDDLTPERRERLMCVFLSLEATERSRRVMRDLVRQFYDNDSILERLDSLRGLRLVDPAVVDEAREIMLGVSADLGWADGRDLADRLRAAVVANERVSVKLKLVQEFRRLATKRRVLVNHALRRP